MSCTFTANCAVAGLPEPSVAVQATVLAPIGNWLPEGGSQKTSTEPQTPSVAVGFV